MEYVHDGHFGINDQTKEFWLIFIDMTIINFEPGSKSGPHVFYVMQTATHT